MNVFKGFDLEKDKKSVEESVEKANNNIFRLSSDFNAATNEYIEDDYTEEETNGFAN